MYRINEVGNQRSQILTFVRFGPSLSPLPSPLPRQKLITAARYMGVGVINYRGGATNSHLYRHTQKFMEHVLCAVWEIIPGLITKPARARACLQLWGNKMAITNEGRIVPQFFSLLLAISFFSFFRFCGVVRGRRETCAWESGDNVKKMSGMINVVFTEVLSEFLCNFWKTRENIERILVEERVSFSLSFFLRKFKWFGLSIVGIWRFRRIHRWNLGGGEIL